MKAMIGDAAMTRRREAVLNRRGLLQQIPESAGGERAAGNVGGG